MKHWAGTSMKYWVGLGFAIVVIGATLGGLAGAGIFTSSSADGDAVVDEPPVSSSGTQMSTAPSSTAMPSSSVVVPSTQTPPVTSTAPPSSSALQPPSSTSNYQAAPGPFNFDSVNVKLFGAMGDGVTDDLPVIQSVLNSNNAVYIPSGTFLVTGPVVVPNNSYVKADGTIMLDANVFTTILVDGGTAVMASYAGDPNPIRPGIWSRNITIDGGIWDSQATTNAVSTLEITRSHNKIQGAKGSILFLGVDGLILKNMVSRNPKSSHVHVSSCKNVTMTGITLDGFGNDGLHFSGPLDNMYVDGVTGVAHSDIASLSCVDVIDSGPFIAAATITTTPMDLSCTNIVFKNLLDFTTTWNVAKVLIHSGTLVTANAINITYEGVRGFSNSGIQIGHTSSGPFCSGGLVENFFVNNIQITSANGAASGHIVGFRMGTNPESNPNPQMTVRNLQVTNVLVDQTYYPLNAVFGVVELSSIAVVPIKVYDFLMANVSVLGRSAVLFSSSLHNHPGTPLPDMDFDSVTIRNATSNYWGSNNPMVFQAGGSLRNLLIDQVTWPTNVKHNMAAVQLAALVNPSSIVFTNDNINSYDAIVYVLPTAGASLVSVNIQSSSLSMRAAIVSVHPPDWEYNKHNDLSVNAPAGPGKVSLTVSDSVIAAPSVFMAVNQTLDKSCFLADITSSTYNPNLWISLPHYNFYSPELATPANATSSINAC